jgi:hypothetical protein
MPLQRISRETLVHAHGRHEGDVAQGAGADPHVLWWQNSKGPLCLAHAASLQGGLLQDPTRSWCPFGEVQQDLLLSCLTIGQAYRLLEVVK